jgi:hypothetical protein
MSSRASTSPDRRTGLGILGIGAAACVACCIGPIVAFLGSLGIVGALSTPLTGAVGVAFAAGAGASAGAMAVRRRRRSACSLPEGTVAVDAPVRRQVTT